jgi:hypothetical protein
MWSLLVEGKMKSLEEIYKGRYFARRDSLNWRAKPVCEAINTVLAPKSVMDVGCAIGDLVYYWKNNMGIPSHGIEGSKNAMEYFMCDGIYVLDLREEIKIGIHFDLVTCFEVAEHIEPEYADQFLSNLVVLGNRILMSAAPPGQGGHYHVNCQPYEYWIEKMQFLGYSYDGTTVNILKNIWEPWKKKPGIKAYYDNLLFFRKGGSDEE